MCCTNIYTDRTTIFTRQTNEFCLKNWPHFSLSARGFVLISNSVLEGQDQILWDQSYTQLTVNAMCVLRTKPGSSGRMKCSPPWSPKSPWIVFNYSTKTKSDTRSYNLYDSSYGKAWHTQISLQKKNTDQRLQWSRGMSRVEELWSVW